MSTNRDLTLRIIGDPSSLSRALGQVETATGRFSKSMESHGKTLTRNFTLPIVGAGVAAGKLAFDFDDSMTKIRALVGASQKQVQQWGDQILDLAPKVGKSPKELADALYFITSSGIDASKAMDALTVSAKLSTAGLGATEGIADGLTSAMNAYAKEGLTAAKAGDIFTATVREGKAEASSIAPVLGNVLPLAAQMGVSFDQVGAAIASMTLKGTDAETAVTNLSATLSAFLHPGKQAADTLASVGLSGQQVRDELKDKGLLATLEMLRGKFKGNDEALAKVLPNIRALRGVLQLTGGDVGKTEALFGRLAHTTNDANKAFDDTAKTQDFKLRSSLARLQAEGIKAGNVLVPIAADIAGSFVKVVDAFDRLPGSAKKAAGIGAVIVAGLGPAMRIVGGISTGVGLIAKGLGAVTGAGKVATVASGAGVGVQKVWVMNPGFNGVGGKGGLTALPGGLAAGAGGVSIPGIGTGIGAAGGIGAGAALGLGAALIGGGMALNAADDKWGIITQSKEQGKKAADALVSAAIEAYRKGTPALQKELQKGMLVDAGPLATKISVEARGAMEDFSKAIKAGQPKAKRSTKDVIDAALTEIGQLSPAAKRYAADSMVRMSASLESGGNAPKGTTKALVAALEKEIGRLPSATRKAAGDAMTSVQAFAAAFNLVVSAAGSAASAVESFAARARAAAANPPNFSAFTGGWGGGGGGGGGKGGKGGGGKGGGTQKSQEFTSNERPRRVVDWGAGLRAVPLGSPTSLDRIGNAGDRAATAARLKAEGTARKAGKSETEISNAGQRAYDKARISTINKLQAAIKSRRAALIRQLAKKRAARKAIKVPAKGNAKQNDARQKALDRRNKLTSDISDIRDELETLAQNHYDLQTEASELGADLKDLDRSDEAAEADAAAEAKQKAEDAAAAQPTEEDYLNAAAAQAQLTTELGDDLAAAQAIEAYWGRVYDQALASGDPRKITDAANGLAGARAAREQIEATMKNTDALNANTDAVTQAFGGSTVFDYRGQNYSLRSLAPPSSDRLVGAETQL